MKKVLSLILAAVLLASFCLTAASCSKAAKLVGSWESKTGAIITFTDDGKVSVKGSDSGLLSKLSIDGTYTTDGDKLTITYKVILVDTNLTYTFAVKGGTLTLTDEKGNSESYTKAATK